MNATDNIYYLAQVNARNWTPRKDIEELEKDIPFIQVAKDIRGKYVVTGHGHKGHDNEPRMDYYCRYFQDWIFPNVEGNASGYYNIELHDSYAYLERPQVDYMNGVMTFAKAKNDVGPILIPDPYMVGNWADKNVDIVDTVPWDCKDDKVCFFGTTTGSRDPIKNRRINMCIWACDRKQRYDFGITHVAQMSPSQIISSIGLSRWQDILRPRPVSWQEQVRNKFLFLPDGNTCKFDVWPMQTQSLCLKDVSDDMLWYYPMLGDKQHFVEVDEKTIDNVVSYYLANPREAQTIVATSQSFSKAMFQPSSHILYTTALFETMAWNA